MDIGILQNSNSDECMYKKHTTIEWGELGHWCELGQKFSESSPLGLSLTSHG